MHVHTADGPNTCFGCKIKSVQLRPSAAFQPHFSHTVGAYVDTEAHFKDQLKYRAEENTLATGTEHVYEMRDPAELSRDTPPTSSDDILNTQARELRKQAGLP